MTASLLPKRPAIDWTAVRHRLAERQQSLQRAFVGEGPWADALLDRRTEELARLSILDGDGAHDGQRLLVASGRRLRYGLDLGQLARVLPVPPVAPVPGARPELLGLIAVFGRVMRLFDTDALCGEPADPDRGFGYAAVLRGGVRPIALRFLGLEDAVSVPIPNAVPPEGRTYPLIRAVTPNRIAVLDIPAIFDIVEGPTDQ